jgi:hypothetical protein
VKVLFNFSSAGRGEILQEFQITIGGGRKKVPVAGVKCTDGTLTSTKRYRFTRSNGTVIYDGLCLH